MGAVDVVAVMSRRGNVELLESIASIWGGHIELSTNEHTAYYQTIEQFFREEGLGDAEVMQKCIDADRLATVTAGWPFLEASAEAKFPRRRYKTADSTIGGALARMLWLFHLDAGVAWWAPLDAGVAWWAPVVGSDCKIERIVSMCKSSVHVSVNSHAVNNETVEEYFADSEHRVDDDTIAACVEANTVATVQAYKHTPIGFQLSVAPTIDGALAEMLELLS